MCRRVDTPINTLTPAVPRPRASRLASVGHAFLPQMIQLKIDQETYRDECMKERDADLKKA